jgi:hypothetical protein
MGKIYCKDDFVLPPLKAIDIRGHDLIAERLDFDITLSAGGYSEFTARRRGNNFYNCAVSDDSITVFCDRHGLRPGHLRIKMTLYLPDPNMPDGSRTLTADVDSSIEIVPYPVPLELSESELSAVLPLIKGETGETGPVGPQGAPGIQGPPGEIPEETIKRIEDVTKKADDAASKAEEAASNIQTFSPEELDEIISEFN